ncbi:MAG: M3 family oligoendopeptidase [Culicoidibacterales bacterium]
MKFSEYPYQRPDFSEMKAKLQQLIAECQAASSAQVQVEKITAINKLRNHIETMATLAQIRHSIDTTATFYEQENNYWDEYSPLYSELESDFYAVILASPYLAELETLIPKQWFAIARLKQQAFDQKIIPLLQAENRLSSNYTKLMASAEISVDGKIYNLSGITPLLQAADRKLRQRAAAAKYQFFADHEAEIDALFDELVTVRHTIATTLGFKNFVELGYVRMLRTDYNAEMVAIFRQQVQEVIVPQAQTLVQRQKQRLGLSELAYYDASYEFTTGNPTPKGDAATILAAGMKMYEAMSPETAEFFAFMQAHELLDVLTKPGKSGGGYCTFLADFQAPFIFANFNATAHDVDVLTHEAGHAFQVYQSRTIPYPELSFPTYESCEIHSMSMEFFAWPWMEQFFGDDTQKYYFSHLAGALTFIPYGVSVDEFQHYVYENPQATPAQRKAQWRAIERKYLPAKDYRESPFLEKGTWWYQQAHIFNSPFYYIDYTLAQVCAFQFWAKMQVDREQAFQDYLHLCGLGGTLAFTDLVAAANLQSPFKPGVLAPVVSEIMTYLNQIDDQKL